MKTGTWTQMAEWWRSVADAAVDLWKIVADAVRERIVEPLDRWNRYRRTVAELHSLNDRMLYDIGIDRARIEAFVHSRIYGGTSSFIAEPVRVAANDNVTPVRKARRSAGRDTLDRRAA